MGVQWARPSTGLQEMGVTFSKAAWATSSLLRWLKSHKDLRFEGSEWLVGRLSHEIPSHMMVGPYPLLWSAKWWYPVYPQPQGSSNTAEILLGSWWSSLIMQQLWWFIHVDPSPSIFIHCDLCLRLLFSIKHKSREWLQQMSKSVWGPDFLCICQYIDIIIVININILPLVSWHPRGAPHNKKGSTIYQSGS